MVDLFINGKVLQPVYIINETPNPRVHNPWAFTFSLIEDEKKRKKNYADFRPYLIR